MKRKRQLPNKRQWGLILMTEAMQSIGTTAIHHLEWIAKVNKTTVREELDKVMRYKYGLPPKPWEPAEETPEEAAEYERQLKDFRRREYGEQSSA